MKIIGVTGGIGSGKSTVSLILKEMGALIINADLISREIVEKGQSALKEIVEFFGDDILLRNGELDRKKLGDIVFTNKDRLESLNCITHKYITENIKDKVSKARSESNTEIIVIDAAIPFQYGFMDTADEIWAVTADIDTRIRRVMARSGLTYDQVRERIKSQKSDAEYMKIADKVLVNNGNVDELRKQVKNNLF